MADYYVGEIRLFAFDQYAPQDFLPCDGRSLPISQYQALYSILGTTYGGDGANTFNLPDLRGRAIVHVGQGTGLSNYTIGQQAGMEQVTLGQANLPSHTHTASVSNQPATAAVPGPAVVQGNVASNMFYCNHTQDGTSQTFAGDSVSASTSGVPTPSSHNNIQPTLVLQYAICVQGLYPYNS